jgi:hypothetical protein
LTTVASRVSSIVIDGAVVTRVCSSSIGMNVLTLPRFRVHQNCW